MKIYKIQYNLLLILMLYMPLHYYLCELLFSQSEIDNILRDVVIIVMFGIYIRNNNGKIKKIAKRIKITVTRIS